MLTLGLVIAALWLISLTVVFLGAAVTPVKRLSDAANVAGGLFGLFLAVTTAAGAGAAITAAFVVNS